jgi:hypothetical protein
MTWGCCDHLHLQADGSREDQAELHSAEEQSDSGIGEKTFLSEMEKIAASCILN